METFIRIMISVLHPLGIGQPSCNWSKMSVDHKLVDKWWCFAMMQFDYFFSVLRWCLVSPRVTRVELIASCIKNNAKFPCNWVQHDPKKIALRGPSIFKQKIKTIHKKLNPNSSTFTTVLHQSFMNSLYGLWEAFYKPFFYVTQVQIRERSWEGSVDMIILNSPNIYSK